MSRFLNEIHGRRVRVIFDDEQNYYYVGRAVVESDYERGNWIGRFTVTISAEPYKYSVTGTDEKWLWDPFSFVDGVVREYAEIPVKGTLDYTIVGSQMPVIPVFTASTDMTVQFEGETYNLKQGSNTIYDIVLKNQEYHLIFKEGFSASTLHRMKHGKPITTKTLDSLCDILDCEISDVIERTVE